MKDLHAELDALAYLPDGWDSYGAPPITAAAIGAAKVLVDSLNIVPTCRGGVSVYLAAEGLSVEFDDEGRVENVWTASGDVADFVAAVLRRKEVEASA